MIPYFSTVPYTWQQKYTNPWSILTELAIIWLIFCMKLNSNLESVDMVQDSSCAFWSRDIVALQLH